MCLNPLKIDESKDCFDCLYTLNIVLCHDQSKYTLIKHTLKTRLLTISIIKFYVNLKYNEWDLKHGSEVKNLYSSCKEPGSVSSNHTEQFIRIPSLTPGHLLPLASC